jgi:hypothetical protein
MSSQLPNVNIISGSDPLAYTSYPLNYSDKTIAGILSKLYSKTGISSNETKSYDDLLLGSTYKRACCMGKKTIPVKIPTPANYSGVLQDINKQFNYVTKEVTIPDGFCGEYTPKSQTCDNFFATYCENVRNDMENIVGSFDSTLWNQYSPECACYGQTYAELAKEKGASVDTSTQKMLNNISPKTYMPMCSDPNVAYQDKQSREDNRSLTVCSALVEIQDASAGQNMAVSNIMASNNCGNDTAVTSTSTTTPTTSTTTPSTSTTTPSTSTTTPTTSTTTPTTSTTTPTTSTTTPTTSTTTPTTSTTTPSTTSTTTSSTNSSSSTSTSTYALIGGGISLSLSVCCIILILIIFFVMRQK